MRAYRACGSTLIADLDRAVNRAVIAAGGRAFEPEELALVRACARIDGLDDDEAARLVELELEIIEVPSIDRSALPCSAESARRYLAADAAYRADDAAYEWARAHPEAGTL